MNFFNNLDVRVIFFMLIIIATFFEVSADILLKNWSLYNNSRLLLAGLVSYFIGTVFWAYSLRYENLSRAISVLVILNMIVGVLIGVYMFKEELSFINIIGIGLGVISLILMEIR